MREPERERERDGRPPAVRGRPRARPRSRFPPQNPAARALLLFLRKRRARVDTTNVPKNATKHNPNKSVREKREITPRLRFRNVLRMYALVR